MSAARAFSRRRVQAVDVFAASTESYRRYALTLTAFALVLAAIVISHRPQSLVHPQFYAEDGQAWFADAHNIGVASVLTPVGGYLLLFQRLVGLAFAPLGLAGAASSFAAVSVFVQVLPPLMFASRRMRNVLPSDKARMAIALAYVVIPNIELTGNLTNTQWHLAVLALLVLLAAAPQSTLGRGVDIIALLLAGLTGPYAIFLLPIAALRYRHTLDRWRITQLAVLGGTAAVQAVVLAISLHTTPRSGAPLDPSLGSFVLIISNQLLTRFGVSALSGASVAIAGVMTAAVAGVIVAAVWRGPEALRYFLAFALLTAAAGMLLPYDRTSAEPAWPAIATGAAANRYFFFLAVGLALSIVALVSQVKRVDTLNRNLLGAAAVAALVLLSLNAWSYAPLADEHLAAYQLQLNDAPSGTTISIPINPPGWSMQVRAA